MKYNDIKKLILKHSESARYFTPEFYAIYLNAINKSLFNRINNIDDTYKDGNITKKHSFDNVYSSDFYNLNGTAYCIFLEIMNDIKTSIKDIIPLIKCPLWINEPKIEACSFFNKAYEIPYNFYNKHVDYITYDGNNTLTIEIV